MSLMNRPEEVETNGELDLTGLATTARVVIETSKERLMLIATGPIDPSNPTARHFQVLEVRPPTIIVRNGDTIRLRGPMHGKRYLPVAKLVRGLGLAISGSHYRIHLSAVQHVWVNGQQIF